MDGRQHGPGGPEGPAEPSGDSEGPEDLLSELERPAAGRPPLQEGLEHCEALLVAGIHRVGDAVRPVTEAFLEADAHRASRLAVDALTVDRECAAIEDAGYLLIARQAPVAGDLRHIVAILRCVSDVQRSASLLRHVLEALRWVHPPSMPEEVRSTVGELGDVSGAIFLGAADAWERHDALAANELEHRDDQVDLLQKAILTELYTGRRSVEEAVSLALLARYYERVADHGVAMAQQVAYFVTGERLDVPDGSATR